MKNFIKNYKFSLILFISILIGGFSGYFLGEKTLILKPFGDLFLNLMFMIIVPLVFFNVSSAIANMKEIKRLGKIMTSILLIFIGTSIISAIVGLIGAIILNPTKGIDYTNLKSLLTPVNSAFTNTNNLGILDHLVNTFTVPDFASILSKKNMLQLIVFSLFFGISTSLIGEKGEPVAKFLSSASAVTLKMVNIIMYYAPIGLGCYFATVIGDLGTQIVSGYLRVFILYLLLTLIYYFGFFTLYAFLANGKHGVKVFWKNAIAPSISAIATCSSAACIPINLTSAKKMGLPTDIAETVIPLGANIHKDGSVFGGVLKIVFLFGLFGKDMYTPYSLISILFVSFLVGAVMGAIPGGGMIGEMLIISVYGFPPEALPIIAVISTIIDAPATLLNSTGNLACSMLVSRVVEGNNFLMPKKNDFAEKQGSDLP